jgi:tRNA pseudouridine32 synthase/23S rRNA pseudouridine746 synthase
VIGPAPHAPRAKSQEHRSPRALAFDPPALKAEWLVESDQSLDAFLAALRDRVGDDASFERLMRHGGVHLDRRRLCDFPEPPAVVPAGTSVIAYWFTREPEQLALPADVVLFDERGLVAIDKPPWWTTQGTRASRFASLERALRDLLGCSWLTPVNRLDRETTGVLLFARDSAAASEAGRQLLKRTVAKEYVTIVENAEPLPDAWSVEGRMARIPHPSHSLFAMTSGDGDWSATRFETVVRGDGRTLVHALPSTGRTHQIRVHLSSGGSPILGDSLYGTGWRPGPLGAERMMLHARAVTLMLGGRSTRIEAPIPEDFPAVTG